MKRWFILLFVLLFSVGFVLAAKGWGDINTGDGDDADGGSDVDVSGNVSDDESLAVVSDDMGSSGAETEYTQDFYIALGVAGVGFLIVVFFVYLFLRRPRNRWKKRKVVRNVLAVKGENSKVVKSKIL